MSQTDREASEVAQEVAQIVQTPEFQRSPALQELLIYLSARYADRLDSPTNEYSIAQDVLKRGADFDPKVDTTVRVRIRRLRLALDAYYAQSAHKRRISVPPRSYDLELVAIKSDGRRGLPVLVAGLGVAGLALGASLFWVLMIRPEPAALQTDYPLVQVMPVENLTGAPQNSFFTDGIQRQLAADLQRFGQVRAFMEAGAENIRDDADFALRAVLVDISDGMDLGVILVRPDTADQPILSARVAAPILGRDYFRALGDISLQISSAVAGRSGAIAQHERQIQMLLEDKAQRTGLTSGVFRCVVLTNRFLDDYDLALFTRAHECFQRVLTLAQTDPFAASSYGTLLYHAVAEFNLLDTTALPSEAIWPAPRLLAYAEQVVARFPSAADPYLLLGSVQNSMGMHSEAELALRQATERNPGDATAFAVLAYLYLLQDRFTESIEMAQHAIRLSAEPDAFVYFPIVFAALALGDRDLTLESGQSYLRKRSGEGAMAVQLLIARLEGDDETADSLARVVSALPKPMTGVSQFLESETIHAALQNWLPELLDE